MRPRSGVDDSINGRSLAMVNSTGNHRTAPRSDARKGYFAATNGLTRILAVNSAPPSQASTPGHGMFVAGARNSRTGYIGSRYRLPVGPPPPLHVKGRTRRITT